MEFNTFLSSCLLTTPTSIYQMTFHYFSSYNIEIIQQYLLVLQKNLSPSHSFSPSFFFTFSLILFSLLPLFLLPVLSSSFTHTFFFYLHSFTSLFYLQFSLLFSTYRHSPSSFLTLLPLFQIPPFLLSSLSSPLSFIYTLLHLLT